MLPRHVLRARRRLASEAGFTMSELLVVVLLIGILAAVALPVFLGQQKKARDTSAKANARNLAAEVESCFVPVEDFRLCDGAGSDDTLQTPDLHMGVGAGQVSVTDAGLDWYEVTAVSNASTAGSHHTYTIRKELQGLHQRTCTAGPADDEGSCQSGIW